jgi:hypothetical protein
MIRTRMGAEALSATEHVSGVQRERDCARFTKAPGWSLRRDHAATVGMLEEITRIQGALKNVGHCVGRSTIRRVLKAAGLPPVPQRPSSGQTFLNAHWGVIAAADFFTTDVWTCRGLVTYYTVFVMDLASRRVQIVGSTPHPNELVVHQVGRTLTAADTSLLRHHRVVNCDRARKWSQDVRRLCATRHSGRADTVRALNANAYAERFVRSINEDCLDRMIPWVSVISAGRCASSWRTITASGITKD